MREMVLNHASAASPSRQAALDWLKDMASGMSALVSERVTDRALRMSESLYEISCVDGWSLYDALHELRRRGAREEWLFIARLSQKHPLIAEIGDDVEDRFLRCEARELPPEDGAPLLMCVIGNGVSVGFPSDPVWDRNEITVRFDELLPDENIYEASDTIDNLARATHAQPIIERHKRTAILSSDMETLWNKREEIFANLAFHPNVKSSLENLSPTALQVIAKALYKMETGNMSDVKSVGGGVLQFRIHFGPGYRIYFGKDAGKAQILAFGAKSNQNQDINTARNLWRNWETGKSG